MKLALSALALAAVAAPAMADVIVPGPPLPALRISASDRNSMDRISRTTIKSIFDFEKTTRTPLLDDVYRKASAAGITGVDRIVSVNVVGYRTFVLAVAQKWLAPQTIGPGYAYFQLKFDDGSHISEVEVL